MYVIAQWQRWQLLLLLLLKNKNNSIYCTYVCMHVCVCSEAQQKQCQIIDQHGRRDGR